jgi:serine/threonine protein phosphatase PrpC
MAHAARLFSGKDLADGELHPLGPGLAAIFTHRCPDADATNQDSCAIIPYDERSGVLAVADGAGGLPAGARASELAIQSLRSTVRAAAKRGEPLREAILDGIERAHQEVVDLGVGAGTTLAVAEIQGPRVRTYHVGDSQIMIIGQKGKIKLQTMSHSPVGYGVEAGLIREEDALLHAERHLVSNLVGQPKMHIEMGPVVELNAMDTLLLASDGLFDNLHTEEIVELCRKGQLLAITSSLAEHCRERMTVTRDGVPSKPDDLTLITYRRRVTTG